MKVPCSSSSKARSSSSLVFITMGPPQETGSLRGLAAIRKTLHHQGRPLPKPDRWELFCLMSLKKSMAQAFSSNCSKLRLQPVYHR